MSRSLSQIGERWNEYGIAYGMRYEELRNVLTEHFRQLLDEAKAEMNDTGPLSELDRQIYETSKLVAKQARKTDAPLSLDVAAAYSKERQRGNAWAAKTIIEKAEHIKLLEEILSGDTDVRRITAMEAKRVKDTLLSYPRNRSKNPLTRGRPLADVLNLPNVEIIQVATINKYLQTYHELFEWAKQNHHTTDNFFARLAVKQSKKNKDGDRDAYTDDQIRMILRAILHNDDGLVTKPYEKWAYRCPPWRDRAATSQEHSSRRRHMGLRHE